MGLLTVLIFQNSCDSKITPVKHLAQDLAGSKCSKAAVSGALGMEREWHCNVTRDAEPWRTKRGQLQGQSHSAAKSLKV